MHRTSISRWWVIVLLWGAGLLAAVTVTAFNYDGRDSNKDVNEKVVKAPDVLVDVTMSVKACNGSITNQTYHSLLSLYDATAGQDWTWDAQQPAATQWSFPCDLSTPCSAEWQGLTCVSSDAVCVITELDLSERNLHGTLPNEVFNLTSLEILILSTNEIRSTLPSTVALLGSTLTQLNLAENSMTGIIPTEIGVLIKLTELYMYDNSLYGSIPTDVGLLMDLIGFELNDNLLSGSIPTEFGLLRNVQYVSLYTNYLSDQFPSEIGLMTALESFDVSVNSLTGNLPNAFCDHHMSITYFYLSDNAFSGSIPTEIGCLVTLAEFEVYSNELMGIIPTQLGLLSTLTDFDIDTNTISGPIPTEVGFLVLLTKFDASENHLSGSLPSEIGGLGSLKELLMSNNSFSGVLPSELGLLSELISLDLSYSCIEGSLPLQLFNSTKVQSLYLVSTFCTGSIPAEMSQLRQLNILDFETCLFSGTLPSKLDGMYSLSLFNLENNFFSGVIPTALTTMNSLETFAVGDNFLSGTLPAEMGNMSSLAYINVRSNQLTGNIPSTLLDCTELEALYVNDNRLIGRLPVGLIERSNMLINVDFSENHFTGPLPARFPPTLTAFTASENRLTGPMNDQLFADPVLLIFFDVGYNLLSGSLPSTIENQTELQMFSVENNGRIHGSIPSQLGKLVSVVELILNGNQMTGSIPGSACSLPNLELLSLSSNMFSGPGICGNIHLLNNTLLVYEIEENYFTGSIPDSTCMLQSLFSLVAATNFISGSVPACLLEVEALSNLNIETNALTGIIPTSCTAQLLSLSFSENDLHGSIPSSIGLCENLKELSVGGNELSGTLPSELRLLSRLEYLNASDGSLHGPLTNLFDSTFALRRLTILDLSNNALTGTLPAELFQTARVIANSTNGSLLEAVILYNNCFHGSLPSAICEAPTLTTMVMDSLTSSPACDISLRKSTSSIVTALVAKTLLDGGIPSCLWSMTSLVTMHLSGNGLKGNLLDIPSNSHINDVALSNNNFEGSIPLSWQTYGRFHQLLLSTNRLSGTLSSDFVLLNDSTVNLQVNRLSGNIPSAFQDALDVNILNGNLFQCTDSSKPRHDPDSEQYVCGSSDANDSVYAWLAVSACVLVCIYFWLGRGTLLALWLNGQQDVVSLLDSDGISHHKTIEFLSLFHLLCVKGLRLMAFYVVCVLPSYLAIKLSNRNEGSGDSDQYSTHTFQYFWVTTAAFVHGSVPTVLLLCYLLASLGYVATAARYTPLFSNFQLFQRRCISATTVVHLCMLILLLVLYSGLVLAVNVLYVVAQVDGLTGPKLTAIQVSLASFKLVANEAFAPVIMSRLLVLSPTTKLTIATYMKLFTFLFGPVIATMASDASCFRYLFTGSAAVSASFLARRYGCFVDAIYSPHDDEFFLVELCALSISPQDITTLTTPVWLYTYQCGSSVLTNYVSVLVYSYLISGIIVPAATLLYCMVPNMANSIMKWANHRVPTFVMDRFNQSLYTVCLDAPTTRVQHTLRQPSEQAAEGPSPNSSGLATLSLSAAVINRTSIVSRLFANLAVLVTFGLASPLLSVFVCIDGFSNLLSFEVLLLRYMRMHRDTSNIIFRECCNNLDGLTNMDEVEMGYSLLLVLLTAELFWVIFVFDMVGDVYGMKVGGLCILAPTLGVHACYMAWRAVHERAQVSASAVLRALSGDVELDRVYGTSNDVSGTKARIRTLSGIGRTVSNPIVASDAMNDTFDHEIL
jgi:Leucine-rich repeat (LRR) protein